MYKLYTGNFFDDRSPRLVRVCMTLTESLAWAGQLRLSRYAITRSGVIVMER